MLTHVTGRLNDRIVYCSIMELSVLTKFLRSCIFVLFVISDRNTATKISYCYNYKKYPLKIIEACFC